MVYISEEMLTKANKAPDHFNDPTFFFDGEYVFNDGVHPKLDGLVGYALDFHPEPGDFDGGSVEFYYVFFKEYPDERFVGDNDGWPDGSTGTFRPWQETLF